MKEEVKKELESGGHKIETPDYDIVLHFDSGPKVEVNARIYKKGVERNGNHQQFSDGDLDILIQDIKDLSDWRHLRRLNNKLKTP